MAALLQPASTGALMFHLGDAKEVRNISPDQDRLPSDPNPGDVTALLHKQALYAFRLHESGITFSSVYTYKRVKSGLTVNILFT